MKSCLPEYRDCTVQEIAEKYIEGNPQISEIAVHQDEQLETAPMIKGRNTEDNSICEETITYDVRFRAVCLGDKKHEADSGILKLLEVLLSPERGAEEKKQILQQDYNIPMTKKLEGEVTEMCNLSEGIEQRGIKKGRAEGRLEGQLETRQESIQNLMKNLKFSMEQAMTALGIPETEWETYRKLNKTHN